MDCVDEILELFDTRGARDYLGEPVSQLEHALQAAKLAVQAGASDALVAAALLHDIGHLLGPEDDPAEQGVDGFHEEAGSQWLARHFGPEVTEPIRLHVMAKRYLCATDPAYQDSLSPASIRSLELQGGPLNGEEIRQFESNPHHGDAVLLRKWDDSAKIPGCQAPNVRTYTQILRGAALRH
jgi:gamma-butyrobetaine dioxygenase